MRFTSGACCLLATGMVLALPGESEAQNATTLVVTGSSMPEPLYKAWADAYHKENPEVTIRYLGVGTSESAHDVLRGSGDFGGGDTPISESELATSKTQILQLPSSTALDV
jgi:ABC-type phosphate transport system substrate-binding protein